MNMNTVNIFLFCQIAYYMFNIAYEIDAVDPTRSFHPKMAVTGKVPLWDLGKGSKKIDISSYKSLGHQRIQKWTDMTSSLYVIHVSGHYWMLLCIFTKKFRTLDPHPPTV